MSNKKENNKWIFSGLIISILSLFLLAAHLLGWNNIKFDSPALVLLFIALVPWLSRFIDDATLPGGWRIAFRKLEDRQAIQESDLDDIIDFLFDNFLNGNELMQLKKLSSRKKFNFKFQGDFEKELRNLLSLNLIDRHPRMGVRTAKRDLGDDNNLHDHFFITEKGLTYLARREKILKKREADDDQLTDQKNDA